MASMLPLTDKITAATEGKRKYNVQEFRYGNGYSQRIKNGLNYARSTWNLEWSGINQTELDELQTAFDDAAGCDTFLWQPFGESGFKFFSIAEWSKRKSSDGFITVTATLNQEFDLE